MNNYKKDKRKVGREKKKKKIRGMKWGYIGFICFCGRFVSRLLVPLCRSSEK